MLMWFFGTASSRDSSDWNINGRHRTMGDCIMVHWIEGKTKHHVTTLRMKTEDIKWKQIIHIDAPLGKSNFGHQ